MSISKPHILVVGVGSIGKVHAQNGACFGHVSVVDHNASLAAQIARDTGATCFGNDLDAALAARPDGDHSLLGCKFCDDEVCARCSR